MPGLFGQVRVDTGEYGISWDDELNLDAEDIWDDGIEIGICQEMDIYVLTFAVRGSAAIGGIFVFVSFLCRRNIISKSIIFIH